MKKRRLLIVLLVMLIFINKALYYIYRSFIYSNNIFDYGIADSFSNFMAVLINTVLSIILYEKTKIHLGLAVFSITLGFIIYEILQGLIVTYGTFDIKDIIATLLGGIASYLLFSKASLLS
ncbi:hypothetical protein [Clostridium hydrogeniformans]|uniref:hypothetical protein n=1 Tax=Clostridium hydrogeniformans TaxID=349933 RepID=UPI000485BDBE|nr:hypothetical protein [Clostridium hydrogeniformans]